MFLFIDIDQILKSFVLNLIFEVCLSFSQGDDAQARLLPLKAPILGSLICYPLNHINPTPKG
jgi:hypothetical protein